MISPILLVVAAYLLGSVPCGLLLGRAAGIDVRRGGSGNIGATNVTRQLGKLYGLATLAGDMAKAVLPMYVGRRLDLPPEAVVGAGLAAFVGHCFPLYLGFRGGKGVATALGVWLFLAPVAAVILLAAFLVLVAVSGFVSVGSLAAAVLLPLVLLLLQAPPLQVAAAVVMALIIWFQHRANIGRLVRGQEKSWRKKEEGEKEELEETT